MKNITMEKTFSEWCDEQMRITEPRFLAEWLQMMATNKKQRKILQGQICHIRLHLKERFQKRLSKLEESERWDYEASKPSKKEDHIDAQKMDIDYYSVLYPEKESALRAMAADHWAQLRLLDFDHIDPELRPLLWQFGKKVGRILEDIPRRYLNDHDEMFIAFDGRVKAQEYLRCIHDNRLKHLTNLQNVGVEIVPITFKKR